ncbi:MAG: ribosome-associated translation inhibitor RaiA [Candidatus Hydrogenedentes bacterium]|nr:ribosome-associated translation inhibitor RaiA [Candidatus Hydrogenedentota bacterium]
MTDALRSHIEGRLEKVRGHFDRVIDAEVVLSIEKHRHIAEITLHANGVHIHGKESSSDMYASVDAVVDKLDKQVRRFKDRISRGQARKGKGLPEYDHHIIEMAEQSEEEPAEESRRHRVVLREKLPMKPMDVEEATLQLELAEEPFLVFSNSETQRVNVLYSRGDGTFGLIEPQF